VLFHLAGDLPRDHRFDGGGSDLLADAGFPKPALERRTDMRILLRHDGTLAEMAQLQAAWARRFAPLPTLQN
jgi:hypothetical protein